MKPSISAIIPVYRSSESLNELHFRLTETLRSICKDYEIVFIEDCGGDNSWDVIRGLAETDPKIKAIKLSRNFGQHNALLCGIRNANSEIIVTLDDDLQNPPEEIPLLLNRLLSGYDVVYGYPKDETHGFLRDCASKLTKMALQKSMGIESASHVSAFRIFRTNLRDAFSDYRGPYVNIEVLLTWSTNKFSAIEVKQDKRLYGQSGYSFRKLTQHAINMMTGFSTVPLQVASLLGLLFGLLGFVFLFYLVGRYTFSSTNIPGFTFLASAICIFSGVQLFAIGIIGEYIARMHFRMMNRPAYFSNEVLNSHTKKV